MFVERGVGARLARGILVAFAGAAWSMPAWAGGFSLPQADTDILYTQGDVSLRLGGIGVFPNLSFNTLRGLPAQTDNFARPIAAPSFALKLKFAPELSCALHYSFPYAAGLGYDMSIQNAQAASLAALGGLPNATRSLALDSQEYGATCAANVGFGPGRFYLLGGPFMESVQYQEATRLGTLNLESNGQLGYRIGLAYAIPQYALRFQVLYRSEVEHPAVGNFTPGLLAPFIGLRNVLPAAGSAILPQSVKLTAQTGIAPGWLAYGSFTWVNWSILPGLKYEITSLGPASRVLNLRDGYTYQLGVGHTLSDRLSGTVYVTRDERTGSTAFILPGSTSVGLGFEYKLDIGKIAAGVSLGRFEAGRQRFRDGANVDGTTSRDWVTGVGLSYLVEH